MYNTKTILFENICLSDIVCGQSAIPPVVISEKRKRIVGGMEVVANAWPWTVSLQSRNGKNGKLICCWHGGGWEHTTRECPTRHRPKTVVTFSNVYF